MCVYSCWTRPPFRPRRDLVRAGSDMVILGGSLSTRKVPCLLVGVTPSTCYPCGALGGLGGAGLVLLSGGCRGCLSFCADGCPKGFSPPSWRPGSVL